VIKEKELLACLLKELEELFGSYIQNNSFSRSFYDYVTDYVAYTSYVIEYERNFPEYEGNFRAA
jgi:hypothetical protein